MKPVSLDMVMIFSPHSSVPHNIDFPFHLITLRVVLREVHCLEWNWNVIYSPFDLIVIQLRDPEWYGHATSSFMSFNYFFFLMLASKRVTRNIVERNKLRERKMNFQIGHKSHHQLYTFSVLRCWVIWVLSEIFLIVMKP